MRKKTVNHLSVEDSGDGGLWISVYGCGTELAVAQAIKIRDAINSWLKERGELK